MAKQAKAKKVETPKPVKAVKKQVVNAENDKTLKTHAMKYAQARFERQAAVSKAAKAIKAKY